MAAAQRRVWVVALTLASVLTIACGELDTGLQHKSTHPSDRGALLGMLSALSVQGEPPLNWNSSVDPCGIPTCTFSDGESKNGCNWEGITCQNYRVHSVDLSGQGLEGHVGGYLCGFTELRYLDLSHNRLSGVSDGCQLMPQLKAIDLSYNLLTGYLPFSSVSMPKLAMLNLSNNGFADYIPNTWGNLTSLEVLDVSYNDITGTVPDPVMMLESLRVMVLDFNCRLCGQLPNSFTRRVELSSAGTNIGAWMCWSNSDSCRQSTSLFIAQIGVSISAIFCFLGACTLCTKFRRRWREEPPHPAVARLPKVKSAAKFVECVASLVVMPDNSSQVFVAFPICQEMPLFRRNPILEAMKKRQEVAAMLATENDAPVPQQSAREGSTSSPDEVLIPIEVDVDAHESVVALVRMPSMTSSEGSIHEDGLEMGPGDESDNETEDSDAAAAAAFVVSVGGDEAQ
eukprot:CAMPEP_0177755614 /NCGR_PEP_ID=MMETSP0491_2-20121128/2659_1 /TAXON_ID=63592 /ORGANISM="Tetraselmis chuii, Strain PLY429" /LENGTH=455 /DNA_ID=CAMNT_0019271121 /DNA_START=852 /DNA_END=2219 /DNA_ORIENTATION=-